MELSHEDIVTNLLSKGEVLNINYDEDNRPVNFLYKTNPLYDLSEFLQKAKTEPSRWGEKYIFVK